MRRATTMFQMPERYRAIYEEGRAAARLAREAPNHRLQVIAAYEVERRERDRTRKIERTMEIARQRTADRMARLDLIDREPCTSQAAGSS